MQPTVEMMQTQELESLTRVSVTSSENPKCETCAIGDHEPEPESVTHARRDDARQVTVLRGSKHIHVQACSCRWRAEPVTCHTRDNHNSGNHYTFHDMS
jgi:hypothetical protein